MHRYLYTGCMCNHRKCTNTHTWVYGSSHGEYIKFIDTSTFGICVILWSTWKMYRCLYTQCTRDLMEQTENVHGHKMISCQQHSNSLQMFHRSPETHTHRRRVCVSQGQSASTLTHGHTRITLTSHLPDHRRAASPYHKSRTPLTTQARRLP